MNTNNEVNNTPNVTNSWESEWVEIHRIVVPADARVHTQESIDSLAASMAREGQLENIFLSKEGDQLVLVYGRGRLEAAKKLNWERIRVDAKEGLTESQKLMMTLAENEEREETSPFYTAGLYKRLMETKHLTQEQLADELGKERRLIGKYAALMDMAVEVRQNGNALPLSLRQCLAIAKLTKIEDQLQVMKECAEQDLSGKALEARVKQLLNPALTKDGNGESENGGNGENAVSPDHRFTGTPVPAFQFTRKGKGLVIRSQEVPSLDMMDLYIQDLRVALASFVGQERSASGVRYAA